MSNIIIEENLNNVNIAISQESIPGNSAYILAVNNGFIGTEAEWLESLKASQDIAGIAINAAEILEIKTAQTNQDNEIALKINIANIINDLLTGGIANVLSAEQGKILKQQIDAINTLLTSDNINLDTVQEIVDAIETVQTSLSTILVNDLTTGGITKALTAEMGKTLKSLIDDVTTNVSTNTTSIGDVTTALDTINGQII